MSGERERRREERQKKERKGRVKMNGRKHIHFWLQPLGWTHMYSITRYNISTDFTESIRLFQAARREPKALYFAAVFYFLLDL